MARSTFTTVCAASALALASAAFAEESAHWSYEGHDGPDAWGSISEDFGVCDAGNQQSPIDLDGAVDAQLTSVVVNWGPSDWTVVNNGHTIQVNTPDAGVTIINGKLYRLVQFHFHTPSEHAISGDRAPMEAHFVHVGAEGDLAVLGVMIEGGGSHRAFDAIMRMAPESDGEVDGGWAIAQSFLPWSRDMFRYQGSLTTPPCSEIVLWSVYKQPLKVSDASISRFQEIFAMNARPLQPVNRRYVLE